MFLSIIYIKACLIYMSNNIISITVYLNKAVLNEMSFNINNASNYYV
jgi:hypothetical protein